MHLCDIHMPGIEIADISAGAQWAENILINTEYPKFLILYIV